jgi:cell wall-associated NlpC family hydrolase
MHTITRAFFALLASVLISSMVVGATATSASALSDTKTNKVMKEAASLKGSPYKWGGTTPKGFDCSGYTQYVFKKATGKRLGRVVGAQAKQGRSIAKKDKKRGDLIIFGNYHVGIYAGDNKIWHASRPGTPVAKSEIWTSGYTVRRL